MQCVGEQNRKSLELYLNEMAPTTRKWGGTPVAKLGARVIGR